MKRFALLLFAVSAMAQQPAPTEIVLLGSDHLAQVYKPGKPFTDVLTPNAQKSMAEFNAAIALFAPNVIMIEELPEKQGQIDSLFTLYKNGKLDPATLKDGRSEIFQIAFPLAKKLGHQKVYCVNAAGGTSQSVLNNGDNIALYTIETAKLRKISGIKNGELLQGKIGFKEYLGFLNQQDTYNKIYHLKYITPARVTNGTFHEPEAAIDTSRIDKKYIGAELSSIWKNRDYKIYSNIATLQIALQPKRMLLLIGVAHIGSLKSILRDDPEFSFIEAATYVKL